MLSHGFRAVAPALAALAGGCLGECSGAGRFDTDLTRATQSVESPRSDSLRFETRVPSRARAGESVRIVLSIRNDGGKPAVLYLIGRTIAFDIVIAGPDGRVVWRRLEGATIAAILRVETLAPGQELTFADQWTQRTRAGELVAPGIYTVHGEFPTDAREPLRTPRVQIRIERE